MPIDEVDDNNNPNTRIHILFYLIYISHERIAIFVSLSPAAEGSFRIVYVSKMQKEFLYDSVLFLFYILYLFIGNPTLLL